MAEKKKFKSKLRDKFKARAAKNEASGRSLGYGDRTAESYYKDRKDVSVPQSRRTSYFDQIKGKVKEASQKRAHEVLSGKLKDGATEVHKGLTGIRHPAQLIPAVKAGTTLAGIIKSLTKK